MHAVILNFPGHFFQTQLALRQLIKFHPEITNISLVVDDIETLTWHDYRLDLEHAVSGIVSVPVKTYYTSDFAFLSQFVSGWWRQQMVKFCLDNIVLGHEWFVVDGDAIFETRCNVKNCVPISYHNDINAGFTKMTVNYVRTVLGTDQGMLLVGETPVCTNAVPFRWLDSDFLKMLRNYVEAKFDKDFAQLHHDWCQDQTIVADWDPPDRMVMSEWELIECYRRYVQQVQWPWADIGSGYPIDLDLASIPQKQNVFRHSYRRDAQIDRSWFEQQGVDGLDLTWSKAVLWLQHYQEANQK